MVDAFKVIVSIEGFTSKFIDAVQYSRIMLLPSSVILLAAVNNV